MAAVQGIAPSRIQATDDRRHQPSRLGTCNVDLASRAVVPCARAGGLRRVLRALVDDMLESGFVYGWSFISV